MMMVGKMIINDIIDKVWASRLLLNEPQSSMIWSAVFDRTKCMDNWAWKAVNFASSDSQLDQAQLANVS